MLRPRDPALVKKGTPPVTASIEIPTGHQHPAISALRAYLGEVTDALGIGLESCTIDHDKPVGAYIALDDRLPRYPDRDLALLWDESRGWSAAIETHSGEDLIVLRYLGGPTVAPNPAQVVKLLRALREDDFRLGHPDPVTIRPAGDLSDLAETLHSRRG